MNINPFDLLKNAGKIQEEMGRMQESLQALVVTGSAGGGMVEIDLNGKLECMAIRIDPTVVDPADITMLQDLVRAAFTDAHEKARAAIQSKLGPMAGAMGLA